MDSGDFIEQDQAENLANFRYGLEAVEGVGLMWSGGLHYRQLQIAQQPVVIINQGQVDCDALLHGGVRKRSATPGRLAL
jgi:hypothetical protein